jgi:hypothetical protein
MSELNNDWSLFTQEFTKAYNEGDVDKLEKLKEQKSKEGFCNINDLGGIFLKYSAGMDRWNELIQDASANKNSFTNTMWRNISKIWNGFSY